MYLFCVTFYSHKNQFDTASNQTLMNFIFIIIHGFCLMSFRTDKLANKTAEMGDILFVRFTGHQHSTI